METESSMVEFAGGNPALKTKGFLVKPRETGKYPAIIVIHEIWGLVDHIKDVANRFGHEGYVALAVDLFEGETVSRLEEGRKMREKLTEAKLLGDLSGAFNYVRNLDSVNPERIASIGFCMGGGLSLLLACNNRQLAGAVSFYGRSPSPIDLISNVPCPVLCIYAGADLGITEPDVNLMKQTLTKYGKTFEIKVYPGVPHAFFNDTRESFRPEAAKDAWQKTLVFFSKYLKAS